MGSDLPRPSTRPVRMSRMEAMDNAGRPLKDNQALDTLKHRILRERGLDCSQYKDSFLLRRLQMRMRATGSEDYLAYMNFLRHHPEEYGELVNELTINVTEFFRDPDTWETLKDEVAPEILAAKQARGLTNIRAWSAGCATGEEPYSLAICFLEAKRARKDFDGLNVKIYATDLDRESLVRARRGHYAKVSMLPGVDAQTYFRHGDDGFIVREELKQAVKFEEADIMAPPRRRYLDLIVCRNLLIYFNKQCQARILRVFHESLRAGGYLVVGRSEVLLSSFAQQFAPAYRRERIYRKEEN